jgi:hypothetical protein
MVVFWCESVIDNGRLARSFNLRSVELGGERRVMQRLQRSIGEGSGRFRANVADGKLRRCVSPAAAQWSAVERSPLSKTAALLVTKASSSLLWKHTFIFKR